MEFVKNHFNITFDEENIYYESLLYNSDFDYLKDVYIKKFEGNPPVYNFLFEVQELVRNGEAQVIDGKLVIPLETFIKKQEEDTDNLFCQHLTLKEPISFTLDIKSWGQIRYDDFRFSYKIRDKKYKDYEIIGCFAFKGDNYCVLEKHIYTLLKAMKDIENIPNDDNKAFNIWKTINDVKKESSFTHSTLSSFFENDKIIIPSSMSIDMKKVDDNLKIVPTLAGLSEEEQAEFQKKCVEARYLDDSYTFVVNNETVRVIITPKIKENFAKLFDLPREIRNKDVQRTMVTNPVGFLPNRDIVSIDSLSERIADFGLYRAINFNHNNYQNNWEYPRELTIYNLSGEQVKFKINDKYEKDNFTELLYEAVVNEYSFFDYSSDIDNITISIPLTPQNYAELKQFFEGIESDEKLVATEKILKEVKLINDKNEYINLQITKEIFEDIKKQIKQIRDFDINDDTEWKINIYSHQIPLIEYNKKRLKEAFETHIILAEDEELQTENDETLNNFFSYISLEIPKSLKGDFKLKGYQKKGLAWLQNSFKIKNRKGVLLADDMGLGKTLQLLSFMFWLYEQEEYKKKYFDENNKKPILVVAPVILLENWRNEYNKFFYDSLGTPLILHGDTLRRYKTKEGNESYQYNTTSCKAELHLDIKGIAKSNVVITNYDTLVNYEFSFASIDWSVVILDEAQEIKETSSHKSTVAKALKADFRIACTGTPVENSLMDLWNIFSFLQPNLLGTKTEFKSLCNNSLHETEENNNQIFNDIRTKLHYEKPYAYILRREKKDVLGDLPVKTINPPYEVPLSPKQIIEYRKLKDKMMCAILPEDKIKAFSDMNKFSQHPRLVYSMGTDSVEELIEECPKFQKLIEILKGIEQKKEKVLIFCIYREIQKYLKLVLEHEFKLDNIDVINGEAKNRQTLINKFQKDDNTFNILILSPRAAGVGLNIVKANHVIHYGRWWNPAKENQATDRVYRIGQEKDVQVYYLIDIYPDRSEHTFDEKLHELIMKKIELAHNFLLPNDIEIDKEKFVDEFKLQ